MTYKFWDVPPVGYEHITPMQFKAMQGKNINKREWLLRGVGGVLLVFVGVRFGQAIFKVAKKSGRNFDVK